MDAEFDDSEDVRSHNEFTVLDHKLFFLNAVLYFSLLYNFIHYLLPFSYSE